MGLVKDKKAEVTQTAAPLHAYERHLLQDNPDVAREEKEAAEEEWASVPTVIPTVKAKGIECAKILPQTALRRNSKGTTFKETWESFRCSDTSPYMNQIKPTISKRGLSGVLQTLFGPPKLHQSLHGERNMVFAAAHCQLQHSNTMHKQVLRTLYRSLVGGMSDVPMIGSHWEDIGFQGNDPGTDLRGVGFLGLLQPLYLISDPKGRRLARDAYRLSHHPTQHFPFFILSLNVTRIALQALRQGCLNRECNRHKEVMSVINRFYASVLLHIYNVWHIQRKTIRDSGVILKDAESYCKSHVGRSLRFFDFLEPLELESDIVLERGDSEGQQNSMQQLEMQAESEIFI